VLDGARQILMERFAEDAALLGELRELSGRARRRSTVVEGKETEGAKFRDYFAYSPKPLRPCPRTARWRSSAAATKACCKLAGARRRRSPPTPAAGPTPAKARIACTSASRPGPPGRPLAADTVRWTWRVKLSCTSSST
jgi:uncharacterized protein